MEGFLTVKEVAELVARNQETIRRKIREKKLEAEALLSNKEGYIISISELIKKRFITKEQSESYMKKKNGQNNDKTQVDEGYNQNSWITIVSEYIEADVKNIPQTIAKLISETDKINKIRRQKNLEMMGIKQTLEMLESEVEGLNAQVGQIVDYIEKLKYNLITGEEQK